MTNAMKTMGRNRAITAGIRIRMDYIVLLLIFSLTSNPFFYWILGTEAQILLPAVLALLWCVHRRIKFTRRDFFVFALFLFVMLAHFFEFGGATIASSLSMLLKILMALVVIRTVPNFFGKYVSIMYGLSIMSLFFFIPTVLGLDLKGLFAPIGITDGFGGVHIMFHHFKQEYGEGLNRNMGFFGEPGLFSGFLILALLFTLKSTINVSRRHYFVLIATLLSTQSTTGYLVGFVVVLLTFLSKNKFYSPKAKNNAHQPMIKGMAIACVLIGFIFSLDALPFLSKKIGTHIEITESRDEGWRLTRYGNAQFDWEYIAAKPMFGWSQLLETRKLEDEDFAYRLGNGLTGFTVRYGFVGIAVFLFFAYRALSDFYGNNFFAAIAIFVVTLLLNGEHFLGFPLFLSLMFLPARTALKSKVNSGLRKQMPAELYNGHLS